MRRLWIMIGALIPLSTNWVHAAPESTPTSHHVTDGFVMEKVAGDPSVVFPMFATFDERGRLFVAESSGLDLYAELRAQTRKCRVSLLEDRDGDGRFETARVFADHLVFPMGLVWRQGRLYVADPPDLVCFEDRNHDGVADERKVLLTGFGHTDNGSLHGLTFGPDGLLYLTMGEPDGYRLTRRDGTVLTGRSGALIRCQPDGADPEVLCRGFENLVEIVFTRSGAIIGTDNWYQKPEGGLRDALLHLVEGGLYPMQPDAGTHYLLTDGPLPPISLYPAVALSGLALYRGDAFPPEMRENLFLAQHNSRKVARHVLIPDRETFRVEDHDFITSDDPDFHPSDVLEDADGSLLVVDTGGWYVQHCPTGRIRNSRAAGGIYRVRSLAGKPADDPWGLKIPWETLSAEQLAIQLEDRRSAVRDRAQLSLSARQSESIPALASVLGRAVGGTAKLHALWALSAISDSQALPLLRGALTNEQPELAAAAAQALSLRSDHESASLLGRLLESTALQVRLAAAQALAHCGDAASLQAIWSALRGPGIRAGQPVGPFLEHALIHAAYRLADDDSLTRALQDAHPRVQKAALLILDQPPRNALQPDAVIARVSATDSDLRNTALQILRKHREWAKHATEVTDALLRQLNWANHEAEVLRSLVLAFQTDSNIQRLVAEALTRDENARSPERLSFLWDVLARTTLRPPPRVWIDALRTSATRASPATRFLAVKTIAIWQIPNFDSELLAMADDKSAAAELRMEALRGVVSRHSRLSPLAFQLLLDQLGSQSNPVLQLAAAGLVGRAELTDAQIKTLLPTVRATPIVSPSVLSTALLRAGEATQPLVLDYFSDAIRAGWRPADEELTGLAAKVPKGMSASVERLAAELRRLKEAEGDRLNALESLLKGGEPERGRRIFFGVKVACSTCHRIGHEGGAVGPDLTKIGAVRSGRDLIESIVLPSSTFAQGYESYSIALTGGRELDGVIANQTADSILLRDSSGAQQLVHQEDVRELKRRTVSLMPEGLDRALSRDEFRDLLAFLQSLK